MAMQNYKQFIDKILEWLKVDNYNKLCFYISNLLGIHNSCAKAVSLFITASELLYLAEQGQPTLQFVS